MDLDHSAMRRREFLRRLAGSGAAAAIAAGIGWKAWDRQGPPALAPAGGIFTLPPFALAPPKHRLCLARGTQRALLLEKAVAALGGIQAFIKPQDHVLIKVNAAFASPAILGATTHPELVTAMAGLCFKAGAAAVTVTDNPINDPVSCFELSGIGPAAREAGARLVLPLPAHFAPASLTGGRLIVNWPFLAGPFKGVTKLIGMAPVKDHHRSGASLTMKNWYGLLGGQRSVFHQDVHNLIKELALLVRPTLVVLDGTVSMMDNGPTGGSLSDLKATETLIVATDPVAADAFGAGLLEKKVDDLIFIAKAAAAGAGQGNWQEANPIWI
jgi:uncharacterized protein (DUF362 family)